MLMQSVQQLDFGPRKLVQPWDDFTNKAIFDRHEVLFGDKHVGANLIGTCDHPSFIGTGILKDQHTFFAQIFSSLGGQKEVGAFDD